MNTPEEVRRQVNQLRRRAEDALRGKPVDVEGLPTEDIQYLLHELQVHQVELTLQNEELLRVQLELEAARDLYSNLYNFAPVGYCTLDRKGQILEANQTLAEMLGVERGGLVQKKLSAFVDRDDQDEYYLHHRHAFDNFQHQVSKIRMMRVDGKKIAVRLESMVAPEDKTRLRTMVSDITEQQKSEKEAREVAVLRELGRQVANQREHERQEMARDLHDGPLQEIIGVIFILRAMMDAYPNSELSPQLQVIYNNLKTQISVLRSYAMELRPPTLSTFGLVATIRSHTEIFQETHTNVHIHLVANKVGPVLPETISLALFRVYQEALNNVLKHVHGDDIQVWVRLEKDEDRVRLEIWDNGPGFDLPETWSDLMHKGHLGLIGMRERAELVGGKLVIETKPGAGTRVILTLELENAKTQMEYDQD